MNIVLLGDSILDNADYVARGQDVTAKLRSILPTGVEATLLANDGAVLAALPAQLERLPATASHLIISAGGNDALRVAPVLREPARSMADAVSRLADIREQFARAYGAMLDAATARRLPIAVCTIYDAQLPNPTERRLASTALSLLNDAILRQASIRRLPVIDLRVLFDSPADYANSIEPSAGGGAKIASVAWQVVQGHDFGGPAALFAAA